MHKQPVFQQPVQYNLFQDNSDAFAVYENVPLPGHSFLKPPDDDELPEIHPRRVTSYGSSDCYRSEVEAASWLPG